MNTTTAGNQAERAVATELVRQGYKIIELNWRTKSSEVDVIAEKDGAVFFVEVKYRSSNTAGDGFDYVHRQKLQHMIRAAESWVLEHDWRGEYELLAASVVGESIDIRRIL